MTGVLSINLHELIILLLNVNIPLTNNIPLALQLAQQGTKIPFCEKLEPDLSGIQTPVLSNHEDK